MDKVIDAVPNISIISQLELLCWKTDETTTLNVKDFIDDSVVLDYPSCSYALCETTQNQKSKNS